MDKYIGYIDVVISNKVIGWAIDREKNDSLEISLLINGNFIVNNCANLYRKGIKAKKIHPTGFCGFEFDNLNIKPGDKIRCLVGKQRIDLVNSPWKYNEPMQLFSNIKKKLFFMHIAKTAGSSLNDFLDKKFINNRTITHLEGTQILDGKFNINDYDFLSGHLRIIRIENILDLSEFTKITILRRPVDQLASHLKWVRHISDDVNSKFFKSHKQDIRKLSLKLRNINFSNPNDLDVFFNNMNDLEINLFDNCQTRYFLPDQVFTKLGKSHLNYAIKTLDKFILVGIMEEYKKFIEILCQIMNWERPIPSKRKNINSNNYGLDLKNKDILKILNSHVKLDNILYNKAYGQFTKSYL